MKESITDQLFNYLNEIKDQPLELKPNEFENLDKRDDDIESSSSNAEKVKKDTGTIVSKEIRIICNNIIKALLSLNDEKFLACMDRIRQWNFEICMREFIMNYYIFIKADNRLRYYITTHLDHIILILKEEFEKNIVKNINLFNFENSKDEYEIQLLRNELRNKLDVMVGIKSAAFNEDSPIGEKEIERLDTSKKNELRVEVMNNLRRENPDLEEML